MGLQENLLRKCLDVVRAARVWGKEGPKGIVRCSGIISRALPSRPSGVWPEGRSEKDLRSNLRGDSRRAESVPGKCYPGRGDLHRACKEENCDCDGRGVRAEETGTHSLRVRWLKVFSLNISLVSCAYD